MKLTRFFSIFALLLTASQGVYAQTGIRDSLEIILAKSDDDSHKRFLNAYFLLSGSDAPAEEIEILALGIVRPFVREAFKDDEKRQHIDQSINYLAVAFAHRERGSDDPDQRNEKERFYMEKALEEALLSGDDKQCAMCYNYSAYVEIKRGDVTKAHEYLYASMPYWDNVGMYHKSSEMLYTIAGNFFEMKDAAGLARVLDQMAEYLKKDNSKQSRYQYNAIKHNYFWLLEERSVEREGGVDYALVDSAMVYIMANVDLVEKSLPELARNWIHGYAHYYLAKELDARYPERNSEIFAALDRAREITDIDVTTPGSTIAAETNAMREFDIMLNSIRAKALFRTGRLAESRAVLEETLILLSGLEDHENLNDVRSTVYRFAVELHEKTGDPVEALHFQALLTSNEARIHQKEKITVINEMAAKYEAQLKQTRIEILTREYRTARQILWLVAGLSAALVVAGLSVILLGRARRKNIEQRLYETALLAELSPQMPVRETIEKIARQVSESAIDGATKTQYLERLERLDVPLLENLYRSSGGTLTGLDMKYIVCFAAALAVRDIGLLFSVEPASVNTVRYRIRKKFAPDDPFRIVI